jgi:hypothetical protein
LNNSVNHNVTVRVIKHSTIFVVNDPFALQYLQIYSENLYSVTSIPHFRIQFYALKCKKLLRVHLITSVINSVALPFTLSPVFWVIGTRNRNFNSTACCLKVLVKCTSRRLMNEEIPKEFCKIGGLKFYYGVFTAKCVTLPRVILLHCRW